MLCLTSLDTNSSSTYLFGRVQQGVLLALDVDIGSCALRNISASCPRDIVDVAAQLLDPRTQLVLKPLGVHVLSVQGSTSDKGLFHQAASQFPLLVFILLAVAFAALFIIVALKIITNRNKHLYARDSHGTKKGTLLGHVITKRNLFSFYTSHPWVPEKGRFHDPRNGVLIPEDAPVKTRKPTSTSSEPVMSPIQEEEDDERGALNLSVPWG